MPYQVNASFPVKTRSAAAASAVAHGQRKPGRQRVAALGDKRQAALNNVGLMQNPVRAELVEA